MLPELWFMIGRQSYQLSLLIDISDFYLPDVLLYSSHGVYKE